MPIQLPQNRVGGNPSQTLARIANHGGGGDVQFPQSGGGGNQGQGLAAGIAGGGQSIGEGIRHASDKRFAEKQRKDEQAFTQERDRARMDFEKAQSQRQAQLSLFGGMISYAYQQAVEQKRGAAATIAEHMRKEVMSNPDKFDDAYVANMRELYDKLSGPVTWDEIMDMNRAAASAAGVTDLVQTDVAANEGVKMMAGRPVVNDIAKYSRAAMLSAVIPSVGQVQDERARTLINKRLARVGAMGAVQYKDAMNQFEAILLNEGAESFENIGTAELPGQKPVKSVWSETGNLNLKGVTFTRAEEAMRKGIEDYVSMAAKGEAPLELSEFLDSKVNPVRETQFANVLRLMRAGNGEWINSEIAGPVTASAAAAVLKNRADTLRDMLEGGVDDTGKPTGSFLDQAISELPENQRKMVRESVKQAEWSYRQGAGEALTSWHGQKFPAVKALGDYTAEVAYRDMGPQEQLSMLDEKLTGLAGEDGLAAFRAQNADSVITKLFNQSTPDLLRSYIKPEYMQGYDTWVQERTAHAMRPKAPMQQPQPGMGSMTPAQTAGKVAAAPMAVGKSFMGAAKETGAAIGKRFNTPWNQQRALDQQRTLPPTELSSPNIFPSDEEMLAGDSYVPDWMQKEEQ